MVGHGKNGLIPQKKPPGVLKQFELEGHVPTVAHSSTSVQLTFWSPVNPLLQAQTGEPVAVLQIVLAPHVTLALVHALGEHVGGVPSKPLLQAQKNEPTVLLQLALLPQMVGVTAHSLVSLHATVGGVPEYPARQVQLNVPGKLLQTALGPQLVVGHSLMSTQMPLGGVSQT